MPESSGAQFSPGRQPIEPEDPIRMSRKELLIQGERTLYLYEFNLDLPRDDAPRASERTTIKAPESKESGG